MGGRPQDAPSYPPFLCLLSDSHLLPWESLLGCTVHFPGNTQFHLHKEAFMECGQPQGPPDGQAWLCSVLLQMFPQGLFTCLQALIGIKVCENPEGPQAIPPLCPCKPTPSWQLLAASWKNIWCMIFCCFYRLGGFNFEWVQVQCHFCSLPGARKKVDSAHSSVAALRRTSKAAHADCA